MTELPNGYRTNFFDKDFSLDENNAIYSYMKLWSSTRPHDYNYIIVYNANDDGGDYSPESAINITFSKALDYIYLYKLKRQNGYNNILNKLPLHKSQIVSSLLNGYELHHKRHTEYPKTHNVYTGGIKSDYNVAKLLQRKKKTTTKPKRKTIKCSCKKK